MKTKNNVQKTILRSVAVVISFVLISLTVSAQDFWKKLLANSSFNEIAIAMTETSKKSETPVNSEMSKSNTLFMNEVSEGQLQIEDWMTDENYFNPAVFKISDVQESSLDVEDWMLNEKLFEKSLETEPELKVEGWMTSDEAWKI